MKRKPIRPGCLRCSSCGACWPNGDDYQPCPECEEPTYLSGDSGPMNADEAHTRMTRARFERWLDANDRRSPVERLERIPTRKETA